MNASSRNGEGTPGRRGASATGAPASTRRRPAAAPPRTPGAGPRPRPTARALGKRPTSIPTTTTWSNSRPFVAWAVARVSGASSRRSSARRARRRWIAGDERVEVRVPDGPAEERGRELAVRGAAAARRPDPPERHAGAARPGRAAAAARSSSPSSDRRVERAARSAAPGTAGRARSATTTAGSSSRLVRARTARVEPSSGQVRIDALEADRLVRRRPAPGRAGRSRPARPGSPWRTARRCARRAGRPARRPAAGSGS